MSDLKNDDLDICISKNHESCRICEGINCNKKNRPQQCIQCNSDDDEDCAKKPHIITTTECNQFQDKCVTVIHGNNTVVRDCYNNLNLDKNYCKENPWHCNICDGDGCNTVLSIDKFCQECNSKENPDCKHNLDNTMNVNCPISAKYPGCYHFVDKTGKANH